MSPDQLKNSKYADKSILTCKDEEYIWEPHEVKPIVYGYLLKLGRNGQWQRRWFECDGQHLSYYKSDKRNKLLATLDLSRVGVIALDSKDPAERTFTIQVAKRHYELCAENSARCKDWVISLNRAKEARMCIAGLSLVKPEFQGDRKRIESEEAQPVVQLTTRRQRLKGFAYENMDPVLQRQIIPPHDTSSTPPPEEITPHTDLTTTTPSPTLPHSSISPYVNLLPLTGWTKQGRSSMQTLSMRLSRFATRMTRLRCVVKEPNSFFPPNNPYYEGQIVTTDGFNNRLPPDFNNEPESQAGTIAEKKESTDVQQPQEYFNTYATRNPHSFEGNCNDKSNNNKAKAIIVTHGKQHLAGVSDVVDEHTDILSSVALEEAVHSVVSKDSSSKGKSKCDDEDDDAGYDSSAGMFS